MKRKLDVITGMLLFLSTISFYGQYQKEQFEIISKEMNNEIFTIEIVLPNSYDSTKKYPIIYFTDWWFASHITIPIYEILEVSNNIEPIIIVGIKRKSSVSAKDWNSNRRIDLTPTNVPEKHKLSGGSKNFLSFIKNELIPDVENKYPSQIEKRGYSGYSLGGLFGTYILLNEPELFKKYLIGSPYLMYDKYLLSKELVKMKPEKLTSIKSIFLAVEEEGDQLKAFEDLRESLIKNKSSNLELESVIIIDEDHYTAIPSTILKGLKFLYAN